MNRSSATDAELDLIRRLLRVLGAQPSHVNDPEGTTSAARLLHDRLRRLDTSVQWFADDGHSPLVIAGHGPQLLVCYLDDADPFATAHRGMPPAFNRGAVSSPGIARKAAVIAAVSRYLRDRDEGIWTLAIETDRHRGSNALRTWLESESRVHTTGLWEASDFPVEQPTVVRGAMGRLHVTIRAAFDHGRAETPFGSVVPDLGHQVGAAIADLLSQDHEVKLDGFYDDIIAPNDHEIETLSSLGDDIKDWLSRVAPGTATLPGRHLAMGIFMAPSLIVRDVSLEGDAPYLPTRATVRLEATIAPGQVAARILDSLIEHFRARIPSVQVETNLMLQPTVSDLETEHLQENFEVVLPVSPGMNPARLLADKGMLTIGFSSIGRGGSSGSNGVTLQQIEQGAEHIRRLGELVRDAADGWGES